MNATISAVMLVLALQAWPPQGYEEIPWEKVPVEKVAAARDSSLARTLRWKKIRITNSVVRPSVSVPAFYNGLGEYTTSEDLEGSLLALPSGMKPILVFRELNLDKIDELDDSIVSSIPTAICVLDFPIGEFDGLAIKEFVSLLGVKEIVISWGLANNIDYTNTLVLSKMAKDVRGAVEYAKRGDSNVFVWVTVCYGIRNTDEWIDFIKNIPFDGVALYGPYCFPKAAARPVMETAYNWSKGKFPNKPVCLAGAFIYPAWRIKDDYPKFQEIKDNIPDERTRLSTIAEDIGFSAIWYQIGKIPNGIYPIYRPSP